MPDFSDNVGVRFLEVMSGRVRGDVEAVIHDDPGDETGILTYNLEVRIPSLRKFLDAPQHVAEIPKGDISWQPYVAKAPITPGRCVLYRHDAATRKRKYFDFEYSFPSGKGYDIDVEGHKFLRNDPGFDVIADMSTVHLTFRVNGNMIARGVVTVHIAEAIRQMKSIEVTGAASKEEAKRAEQAFFAWMNNELRDVYPEFPLLLKDEDRLSREERRTLELCIRVMLPDPLPPEGAQKEDILGSLEQFLSVATASEIEDARNGLQAVGVFLSIFGSDVKEIRKAVKRELDSRQRTPLRDVLAFVHSLVVLPYYSHPRTDAVVGYRRPVHVPRFNRALPVQSEPPDREFDVAIAGSGPAGSLLAARLAKAGRSVLLLEAGPHTPEKDITSDELMSIALLYKNSGLQRANVPISIFEESYPTFFVLQGGCVGGGAVINNAVCFRMPATRLEDWQSDGFPLSASEMDAGYAAVAAELGIVPSSEATGHLNPGAEYLVKAWGPPRKPSAMEPPRPGFYECLVNLERTDEAAGAGCIGTGLCNVGCGSERKRNAMQVHLPEAVANGCVIVADARLTGVELEPGAAGGERTVSGWRVRLRDGRRVTVRARQYVVSCGPIGSTEVLLRSDDVMDHVRSLSLPLGRRFSANIGSPLFVFTRDNIHERPSLQIAHYYFPEGANDGFVMETWYNPPAANAVGVPGFMAEHFARMKRYPGTLAAAPLVGTRPSGRVRMRDGKLRIDLPIGEYEISRMAEGLALLANAFLQNTDPGPVEFALAGFDSGREMRNAQDVERFRQDVLKIGNDKSKVHRLRVGTGHPQGGNAMSEDPHVSVVDARFRLRGVANLRICDGSIFPNSAGINPQWTIMALADRCARLIDDELG
jgi:choline dehydrogenase-like flavoprotein